MTLPYPGNTFVSSAPVLALCTSTTPHLSYLHDLCLGTSFLPTFRARALAGQQRRQGMGSTMLISLPRDTIWRSVLYRAIYFHEIFHLFPSGLCLTARYGWRDSMNSEAAEWRETKAKHEVGWCNSALLPLRSYLHSWCQEWKPPPGFTGNPLCGQQARDLCWWGGGWLTAVSGVPHLIPAHSWWPSTPQGADKF